MPTGWLEEEFNSSPPYSPQYSASQSSHETPTRETEGVDQIGLRPIAAANQSPSDIESQPNFQHFSGPTRGAFRLAGKEADDEYRAALTRGYPPQSRTTAQEAEISTPIPGLSTLPVGVGLGIDLEAKSDLDSLFGDSEISSDHVEDPRSSQSREKYNEGSRLETLRDSEPAIQEIYAQEIKQLARQRFEQDLADARGAPVKSDLPICQPSYRSEGTRTFNIGGLDISTTSLAHGGTHHGDCSCDGNLKCSCRPIDCLCDGCDHSDQIDEMMQEHWQRYIEVSRCGCAGYENRCSCLPGLCRCDNCHEHSQAKSPFEHHPRACYSSTPNPSPWPWQWQDVFPGGEMILDDTGHWTIRSQFPPIPWKVVKSFIAEVLPVRQNMSREERDIAVQDFHKSIDGPQMYHSQGIGASRGANSETGDNQVEDASHYSRSAGGSCACRSNACSCAGGLPSRSHKEAPTQVANVPDDGSCSCTCGGSCKCNPGSCQCGPSSSLLSAGESRNQEPNLVPERGGIVNTPMNYLSVSDLAEVSGPGYRSQAATPKPYANSQSQIPSSHPDTPRPHPGTAPSTQCASETRPEYLEQMPEFDSIRQSVEPEVPLANWQRESTRAYEDRSLTPSPISRRGDVEMLDSPSDRSSVPPMLPPIPSVGSNTNRSHSPTRPPIPPIPSTLSPLKVAKRDERHKSGVQGSKVDKRSVTGSPTKPKARSKSRNITKKLNANRQPHLTVGELVGREEDTVKLSDNDAAPQLAPKTLGRVGAAVANIEAQISRQQEEKDKKQKDGTPVRRSQRKNKGVRNSSGLEK